MAQGIRDPVTDEPRFVDLDSVPLVADEEWLLAQVNGNGAAMPAQASGWIARTLASVSDEPPVRPELALGILYPGKRHVFSGPQESAKTLAAYVCGLEVVRAGSPIVLVDFEMGEYDAKRRMRELGATDDELEEIAYVEPQTPATPLAVERLIAAEPALVIVDAAAGAFQVEGLDDNSRRDVELWAQSWVNPFWRAQIATLVLDHVTKNAETRGNYAIGSERKVGGVDVHIGFQVIEAVKRGSSGRYKVTTHKDRGGFLRRGKLGEFALRSDPETHAIAWELEPFIESSEDRPFRPTVKMEQASIWLERQFEDAVPMSHIEAGVGGDRGACRIAIQTLVDEGWFVESQGKHKARMMSVARAYRQRFDDLSETSPDLSGEVGNINLSGSPFPYRDGDGRRGVEADRRGRESEELSEGQIEF